ncbi:imelysin family protein [Agarivorans gilvus]|uniref:Lipoprotein n=1 Tax=Agarivorans gilvus TaxID=680279 RepID=A0ABQ1I8L2_9ALTE|nr:imelysin family protein [Agarivorans gilvus]GGB20889.1 lipoprotein [Agarivorans gilvus]
MKKNLIIGCVVAGWWFSSSAAANQQETWLSGERQTIAAAANQLLAKAQSYQQQLNDYCAKPEPQGLAKTQQAWQQNYQAYLPLQATALGPLVDLKLNWALSYWPDKKDTAGRKVKAALASEAKALSRTHSNLRSQAYLLFETLRGEQRCALLPQTLEFYLASVEQVQQGLSLPALEQLEHAQQLSDFLNSYRLQASQMLRKLRAMYSAKHQRLRPYQGEAWRANLSMALLRQQLSLLQARYHAYLQPYLASVDGKLAEALAAQFVAAGQQLPQQEPSATDANLAAWQEAEQALVALDALFVHQVPQALNIELGFNNNDGD